MAESERFELSVQCSPYTRFPGVLLQPLGQLSKAERHTLLGSAFMPRAEDSKASPHTTTYNVPYLESPVNVFAYAYMILCNSVLAQVNAEWYNYAE